MVLSFSIIGIGPKDLIVGDLWTSCEVPKLSSPEEAMVWVGVL